MKAQTLSLLTSYHKLQDHKREDRKCDLVSARGKFKEANIINPIRLNHKFSVQREYDVACDSGPFAKG